VDEALFFTGLPLFVPIMLAAGFLPRCRWVLPGVVERAFQRLDPSDANSRLGFQDLSLCG